MVSIYFLDNQMERVLRHPRTSLAANITQTSMFIVRGFAVAVVFA